MNKIDERFARLMKLIATLKIERQNHWMKEHILFHLEAMEALHATER